MHEALFEQIHKIGLVPVVKIDDAGKAVGLAKAMVKGGLPCAEVTFRTAAAEEAIKQITAAVPEMLVGAGTVTNLDFAKKAVAAGAKFIVSPGFNPTVVDWCLENNVPIVPGVCTPSDIEAGLSRGLSTLKFFPAEVSGGVEMLKNLAGPFPNLMFMPTGGISPANLASYAKQSNVLAVGGSWMVKPELIEAENWDAISALCSEAVVTLQGLEFAHLGINNENAAEAEKTIAALEAFGMVKKVGNSSTFLNTTIEVLPKMYYGRLGHLGFKCFDIERTLAYLGRHGFTVNEETITRDAKGKIKVCYIQQEFSGFAVHLIKA
ncbi:MAG: bifunctional 4-hydroxy-2-oxoglutarate aldolase/2-dehydro-3-deoxy-phosphogluconate aldolase [Sphaerochaeta sp.]|jgi:2-dehydro-3-deoxyphosphogluconate aldolase/(4S)-4-hydroxy-2-oxoglutarate aldolase|uniref:bifunctional 4-hydroxy-2-oxoglutarate aldolase/2-dehydro-3-deoxy-phosphogluconate aldolase n=1 Tax=unclassified Sphaerochaeta TaxID=2637943 RepID=UPI000E97877B|nr:MULTISPECIES: bifunctional 4-hydroxy-2-oxoglutarate aldolase/2-dehydro-3-deoxy-phosphogluconate aldolase [unclassified Sphaerochaeta]MCK9600090.1 bifunctional 4-hydroxy-2-oxoglutarate aldolase/2-dehydro-3-deoxy-phosphogluconate aldolase [Sphaerochaeta sp.]MDX9824150.1 bifunctional 4-hydroxy-2-oxoglutarate aldolase/2-dehydro-3-deoxy-phosphogluconate aldolase [Sphaerochaeta sp.]HBO36403.1 2-dehydro-3-deoxyphosphogluconate aldolase [Sphaerochaeta sp.]HPE92193.1 bifunctional 4-hydroxy-2-oxogluta